MNNIEFVNSTSPAHFKNPKVRWLVKSHASKGVRRARKEKKHKAETSGGSNEPGRDLALAPLDAAASAAQLHRAHLWMSPSLYPGRTNLSAAAYTLGQLHETGLKAEVVHRLLAHYWEVIMHAVYPLGSLLSYNPVRTEWIVNIVHDEALFRAVTLAAAVNLSLSGGFFIPERERDRLADLVLRTLSERISSGKIDDMLLGAIACLAMLDVSLGFSSEETT